MKTRCLYFSKKALHLIYKYKVEELYRIIKLRSNKIVTKNEKIKEKIGKSNKDMTIFLNPQIADFQCFLFHIFSFACFPKNFSDKSLTLTSAKVAHLSKPTK